MALIPKSCKRLIPGGGGYNRAKQVPSQGTHL